MKKSSIEKNINNNIYKSICIVIIAILLFICFLIYVKKISGIDRYIGENIKKDVNINIYNQKQNNDLEKKREEINKSLSKNVYNSLKVKQDMSNTFREVMELQNQITINDAQIQGLIEQINILNQYIANTKKVVKTLESQKNAREGMAKKRLKTIYMNGENKKLEVLLSSKGILDFFSNYYMIQEINELDNNIILNVARNRKIIRKAEDNQVMYEKQLLEKGQQLQKIKQSNQNYIVLKNAKLSTLTEEEKQLANNIETLEKERLSIEAEISREAMVLPSIGAYVGGVFAWPVPSCNSLNWITARYGEGWNSGYPGPNHSGVDIAIPSSEVGRHVAVAAQDGRVIVAVGDKKGSRRSYGNYIVIDHGGGIYTLYGHADSIMVQRGQYVKKGEPIMFVGSTGNSTGPHLHFEVRIGGPNYSNKKDPLPFITNQKSPEAYIQNNTNDNVIKQNTQNNTTNIQNNNTVGKSNSINLN